MRDAGILTLAVVFAFARAVPIVAFPTLVHQGKGPVFLHVPLLGLALASALGWPRPFRAVLLFALAHAGAVLAFEWQEGIYTTVLGKAMGAPSRLYLILGNIYIPALLIGLALCVACIVMRRGVRVPALPDAAVLVPLFAVSFLLRFGWGLHVLAGGQYLIASDDGQSYHRLGRNIVLGVMPTPDDYRMLGGKLYWYFLAGIYRVAGLDNFPVVIAVQALLGALIPVAVYKIAMHVTASQPIAAVSGLFVALNRIMIFLAGVLGMEALYLPLFFVALAWLISRPRREIEYAGVGILFGLANLARNELVAFPFVLLFVTAIVTRHDRAAIRGLVFLCLGYVSTMAASYGLTYLQFGRFTLPNAQAPLGFALEKYGIRENVVLDEMGFNPFRDLPRALALWVDRPGVITSLLAVGFAKRLTLFLLMPGDGLFDPLTITASEFINFYFPSVQITFPTLVDSYALLFCVIGLIVMYRHQIVVLYVWIAWAATLNAVIVAKSPRHRAVLIPLFVLATVRGAAWLVERVRRERAFDTMSLPAKCP